jgi:outer membrane protein assembly factor BamB
MNMWHGGYSITGGTIIAYGKLFSTGYGGIVYCHDITTGDILWSTTIHDPYNEILWGVNWPLYYLFTADNKIYFGHTEHSAIDPKPRGAPFVALDVNSGDVVWRIDGAFRQTVWGGTAVIGDGIIATMDTYDQRIYAIGKGPSSLTVDTLGSGVTVGSCVTISGTVLDVSPGTKSDALVARFPNGVPAMSDGSMSEWMLYVYKQFERPADAGGVTVTIEAVDGNGNYQLLGTTTRDAYGNFAFSYEPTVEGQYMIIATFAGSASYYGSTATAYFTAGPAYSAGTPIEPDETPDQTPDETADETPDGELPGEPLISNEILIVAVVAVAAVIGVAAYWALRRRR